MALNGADQARLHAHRDLGARGSAQHSASESGEVTSGSGDADGRVETPQSQARKRRRSESEDEQAQEAVEAGLDASRWDDGATEANVEQSRWDDDEGVPERGTSEGPAEQATAAGPGVPQVMGDGEGSAPAGNKATPDADLEAMGRPVPASPVRDVQRKDMLQECRRKEEFEIVKQIGAGTFGLVSKAIEKATNKQVALKKIKLDKRQLVSEGFPMTSVREINILLMMQHPNIVNVTDVMVGGKDEVYMVMDFVQHDLKTFLDRYSTRLKIGQTKRVVHQLLEGTRYLHENWVLHRDLKPANILYDHVGDIKICDFGLARHYGDPVADMTPMVVTRNYRGPEICLGIRNYSPALDVWSIGVIAAELLTGKVPFIESKCDIDLVNAIARVIGSPHGAWPGLETLPKYRHLNILRDAPSTLRDKLDPQAAVMPSQMDFKLSQTGFELIEAMLRWDPTERISTEEALQHAWFQEAPPLEQGIFMPQLHSTLRQRHR